MIPVLLYHSIADIPGNPVAMRPELFEAEMAYLAREGYTPLTLESFLRILYGNEPSPPKPVLLTFDDGYANNDTVARPVLERYGFPATLFFCPGFEGQEGYLTWKQVRRLQRAGWSIEPHTMNHVRLPDLDLVLQRREIVESKRAIEKRLGRRVLAFSYPYGEYDERTLEALRQTGIRYAFALKDDFASSDQPPLELRRLVASGDQTLEEWAHMLKTGRPLESRPTSRTPHT
ncbi:hypothetical protein J31TS4_19390 [Paenibacillus sp. J31TS4]|nr:hypothetical protein J31TS4_19390 [Paenibacillus sp. J31TS4]